MNTYSSIVDMKEETYRFILTWPVCQAKDMHSMRIYGKSSIDLSCCCCCCCVCKLQMDQAVAKGGCEKVASNRKSTEIVSEILKIDPPATVPFFSFSSRLNCNDKLCRSVSFQKHTQLEILTSKTHT